MLITKHNKRILFILGAVASLLLIPLVATNISNQVNWDVQDFVIAAILLCGTALIIELILRQVRSKQNRIVLVAILLVTLLIIWAELAVGIFGTPIAGS